jgi:hypothetical protein
MPFPGDAFYCSRAEFGHELALIFHEFMHRKKPEFLKIQKFVQVGAALGGASNPTPPSPHQHHRLRLQSG